MSAVTALTPDQLRRLCDVGLFEFETTDELEDLSEVIGQARALDAIRFGVGIKHHGFNLFAMGPSGSGKHGVVSELLTARAADEPPPLDWCYLNNFADPHKPRKLALPKGIGAQLRSDMSTLVDELRSVIPAVFESDEYRARAQEIEQEFQEQQEEAIERIREQAREKHIALIRTPSGFAFAPMHGDKVVSPKDFQRLSDEEKARVQTQVAGLQDLLQKVLNQIPQWRRQSREKMRELNREVTMAAVGHLIDELRDQYHAHDEVLSYLDAVRQDVIDNVDDFRRTDEEQPPLLLGPLDQRPQASFRRYEVNVLVDHAETEGAPVVFEDTPTFQNLVGRIEHMAMMGALITDFTLIKPGALHRANNGYLVVEALKLLQHPLSWEALKRALCANELRIGSMEQMLSLVSTVSLDPEPIPLNIKVVLIGERMLYYLLYHYDPEFKELFKVAADFEEDMDNNPQNHQLYARLVATLVKKQKLLPFDRSGVARVIEHSARVAGDAEKLTTHMRSISDVLSEADYWAMQRGHAHVTGADVQTAIHNRLTRASRMKERLHHAIDRGTLLIDTDGARVGQINGLSVVDLGDAMFGTPTRITAQARLGEGDVVDIEREVELGGPIHSKGVMILTGFLGARYAQDKPMALSASLVFEQSYGEIEGDSASCAELYALLSSLAEVPIKQCFAVTGSVNQHGEVQAIGGVNEKIEGFFEVCKARGLAAGQGVLIPASNVKDLMLSEEVVAAAGQGQFSIYPVTTIDEGIELLTGVVAGDKDDNGQYPPGSINGRVSQRLKQMADIRHEYGENRKEVDAADECHDKPDA